MAQTLVHLVYIHGFQGNDMTFQSFPIDLQQHLSATIPLHLNIKIQTSLYPTYKSVKPISVATKNFLEWLSTQPPGPVILLGHSMGGLLAADAATDISNNIHPGPKPRRIIGVVAFDTPYLGMHPHVVVSGIASLFPKDDADGKKQQTEGEMNDHDDVKMVDPKVTDDWEAFKTAHNHRSLGKQSHSQLNVSRTISPAPSSPAVPHAPFVDRTINFLSSHADDALIRWIRKHSDEPFSAGRRWVTERFQFGICMFDPSGLKERYTRLVAWDGLWVNYWTQTVPKTGQGSINRGDEDNKRKKSGNIEEEGEAEEVEQVADSASGTPCLLIGSSEGEKQIAEQVTDHDLLTDAMSADPDSPPPTSRTKSEIKTLQKAEKAQQKEIRQAEKAREKDLKRAEKKHLADIKREKKAHKVEPPRHFIVLPTGMGSLLGGGEKWEKVTIGGVEDEVAAHCGLFISGQNLDYEGFVERVGVKVIGWCKELCSE